MVNQNEFDGRGIFRVYAVYCIIMRVLQRKTGFVVRFLIAEFAALSPMRKMLVRFERSTLISSGRFIFYTAIFQLDITPVFYYYSARPKVSPYVITDGHQGSGS